MPPQLDVTALALINPLARIIQPGVVGDLRSYWAMHFCSVLEALRQQRPLQYSFVHSIPEGVIPSIGSLIANTPAAFFGHLKASIHNFGLQYFLCHYLMSSEGRPAVVALLDGLANAYNYDLSGSMQSFSVFVCGADSYSGGIFLRTTEASIFGYDAHTIQNVWNDINYVDLCILIERSGVPSKLAVLGEVEGNNGAKLLRESFWGKKSSFCCFGIGVAANGRQQMELQTIQTETGLKSILILSSNSFVVEDFKRAIEAMDYLTSMRPSSTEMVGLPSMRSVVDMIRSHWNGPVDDLIRELQSMIVRIDSRLVGPELIALPSVPNILL